MTDTLPKTLLHRALALIVAFQVNLHNHSAEILARMRKEYDDLTGHPDITPALHTLLTAATVNAENQPLHTVSVIPAVDLVPTGEAASTATPSGPAPGAGATPPNAVQQRAMEQQQGEAGTSPAWLVDIENNRLNNAGRNAGRASAPIPADASEQFKAGYEAEMAVIKAQSENQQEFDAGRAAARAGETLKEDAPEAFKNGFEWETAAMKEEAANSKPSTPAENAPATGEESKPAEVAGDTAQQQQQQQQ